MKPNLLLDSADINSWKELIPTGIFKGITTNPSLILKAGLSCELKVVKKLTQKAKHFGCKEIHIQAWGQTPEELRKCAYRLGKLNSNSLKVHIKIPLTSYGIKAASDLISKGQSITFTACFDIKQILIAAALGATYIAPYLGRINDQGNDGINKIIKMNQTIKLLNSDCKILVASIRDIQEIFALLPSGINTFSISPNIAMDLLNSPSSIEASDQFNKDAKRSQYLPNLN